MTLVLDFAPAHWNAGTRLVALAIADRIGTEWDAYPSIADIARRTGLKPRMVRYHVSYLEEQGVIRRQERRRDNGSQASNLWIWVWRICAHPDGGVHSTAPGG
jgi:predicted transcriptional regulator